MFQVSKDSQHLKKDIFIQQIDKYQTISIQLTPQNDLIGLINDDFFNIQYQTKLVGQSSINNLCQQLIKNKIRVNFNKQGNRITEIYFSPKQKLLGGGNIPGLAQNGMICATFNTCLPHKTPGMGDDDGKPFKSSTSQEQIEAFMEMLEAKMNDLQTSSKDLKDQNSKVLFSNTLLWISSNQLTVFDIMSTLKPNQSDVIETFEDSIPKMLVAIDNLVKQKNAFLAQMIGQQTAVYATSIYRFYMSNQLDDDKFSKMNALKSQIKEKVDSINVKIDRLATIYEISCNALEQSIKILDGFVVSLPEKPNYAPMLGMIGGIGKLVMSGGTAGWGDLIGGLKEGLNAALNASMKQESIDNYNIYLSMEKVKFQIFKTLVSDMHPDEKEKEVNSIFLMLGQKVEKNNNWFEKYLFVQMLGEIILYQAQIDKPTLETKLSEKLGDVEFDIEEIWKNLVDKNKLVQFDVGSGEKQSFIKLARPQVMEVELSDEKAKDKKNAKEEKNKVKQVYEELENVLQEMNPVTQSLRQFLIRGEKGVFNGLLTYLLEGFDDAESMASILSGTTVDIFEGKDHYGVIQVSVNKITALGKDFFTNQFATVQTKSEDVLRNIILGIFQSERQTIIQKVLNQCQAKTFQNTIINTSSKLEKYTGFVNSQVEQVVGMIQKIVQYIQKVLTMITSIQDLSEKVLLVLNESQGPKKFLVQEGLNEVKIYDNEIQDQLDQIQSKFQSIYEQTLQLDQGVIEIEQITNDIQVLILQKQNLIMKFEKKRLLISQFQMSNCSMIKIQWPKPMLDIEALVQKYQQTDSVDKKQQLTDLIRARLLNQDDQNAINTYIGQLQQKFQKSREEIEQKIQLFQEQNQMQQQLSEKEIYENHIIVYMIMINDCLKVADQENQLLLLDFNDLQLNQIKSGFITNGFLWTDNLNLAIMNLIKDQVSITDQDIGNLLDNHISSIQKTQIQEEMGNMFIQNLDKLISLYQNLAIITDEIFDEIANKKNTQPPTTEGGTQTPEDEEHEKLMTVLQVPLEDLKKYVKSEVKEATEDLCSDVQAAFKEVQNNAFSGEVKIFVNSVPNMSNLVSLDGISSFMGEKFKDNLWRIRDRVILILFDLNKIYGGEDGDSLYGNVLVHLRAKEINLFVLQTLKNEELISAMTAILSSNWKTQESEIKIFIQEQFKALEDKVASMKDGKDDNKEAMMKVYEKYEAKLNQKLDNISGIASMAGVAIEFLKDLKKQMFKLQQDVAEIKAILGEVKDDMKLLRGKNIFQLFSERKKTIVNQQQQLRFSTVYIETTASSFRNSQIVDDKRIKIIQQKPIKERHGVEFLNQPIETVRLMEKFAKPHVGEKLVYSVVKSVINQVDSKKQKSEYIIESFINSKKNSLLIHGPAGCGKSTVTKQIEEYLWQKRKFLKSVLLDGIMKLEPKQLDLLNEFSINQIHEKLMEMKILDEDFQFSSYFIKTISMLDDAKTIEELQQENTEEKKEEGEEEEGEQEEEVEKDPFDEFSPREQKIIRDTIFNIMPKEYEDSVKLIIFKLLLDHYFGMPIPIYVQLPKIIQPMTQIFQETMRSTYYFDDNHIRKLRDLVQKGQIKLIFIFDGYDELKQEYQNINLFYANEMDNFKVVEQTVFDFPKIITTCRTEYLTSNNYASIFYAIYPNFGKEKYQPENNYEEYQITDLKQSQIDDYMRLRFEINLKTKIFEFYYEKINKKIFKTNKGNFNIASNREKLIVQKFEEFWQQILDFIDENEEFNKVRLRNNLLTKIFETLKADVKSEIILEITPEEIKELEKQLKNVWTCKMFMEIIDNAKLGHLLYTPFMLSVFLEAIPSLVMKQSMKDVMRKRITVHYLDCQETILKDKNIILEEIMDLIDNNQGGQSSFLDNFNLAHKRSESRQKLYELLYEIDALKKNNELKENVTDIVMTALYDSEITRYELYSIFIGNYVSSNIEKMRKKGVTNIPSNILEKDCQKFARRLAQSFNKYEITSFESSNQTKLYKEVSIWDEFFEDDAEPIRQIVRQCIPFVSAGNSFYFMHRSIKDYILAEEYFELVNKLEIKQFLEEILQFKEQMLQLEKKALQSDNNYMTQMQMDQSQQENKNVEMDIMMKVYEKLKNQNQYIEMITRSLDDMKCQIKDIKKTINKEVESLPDDQGDKLKDYFFTLVKNADDWDKILTLFLTKREKKIVDVSEFLLQQAKILDRIKCLQLNNKIDLYSKKNEGVLIFLSEKLQLGNVRNVTNNFQDNLIALILLAKLDPLFSVTGMNALGLLCYARYSIFNFDFSNLHMSQANLFKGQFYKCQFKNNDFTFVNMSNAYCFQGNFHHSNVQRCIVKNTQLNQSSFTNGCNLNNLETGILPDLIYKNEIQMSDGTYEKFQYILIHPFKPSIVVVFHEFSILFINIDEYKVLKKIGTTKKINPQIIQVILWNRELCIIGFDQEIKCLNLDTYDWDVQLETISLKRVKIIRSIQLNIIENKSFSLRGWLQKERKNNYDILVSGNDEYYNCYMEIWKVKNDQLIPPEESDIIENEFELMYVNPSKPKQLLCYKYINLKKGDFETIDLTILDMSNKYKQLEKYESFKRCDFIERFVDLETQKKQYMNKIKKDPTNSNITMKLESIKKGILEILFEVQVETPGGAGKEPIIKKNIFRQIRTVIAKEKIYGIAQQITIHKFKPKRLLCAYQYGMIKNIMISQENEAEEKQQVSYSNKNEIEGIQFILQINKNENQFIAAYQENQNQTNIVMLKFKYVFEGKNKIKDLQTLQYYNFNCKQPNDKPLCSFTYTIIQMFQKSKCALDYNMTIKQEESGDVILLLYKFDFDFSENKESTPISINLYKYTQNHYRFEKQSYLEQDDNIILLLFTQQSQTQKTAIIFYDIKTLQFYKELNFNLSQEEIYQTPQLQFQILEQKISIYTVFARGNFKFWESNISRLESGLFQLESKKEIKAPDNNRLVTILGVHPHKKNIIIAYDYVQIKILQYDTEMYQPQYDEISLENDPIFEKRGEKNYLVEIYDELDEQFKRIVQKGIKELLSEEGYYRYQPLYVQFQDHMQIMMHPNQAYVFFAFKKTYNMISYSIHERKIKQVFNLPFYSDFSTRVNMIYNYLVPKITIVVYSAVIKLMEFQERKNKFKTAYMKVFSKPSFIAKGVKIVKCLNDDRTKQILTDNDAQFLDDQSKNKTLLLEGNSDCEENQAETQIEQETKTTNINKKIKQNNDKNNKRQSLINIF